MEKYKQRILESMEENGFIGRSELYNLVGGKRRVENIDYVADWLTTSEIAEPQRVPGEAGRFKTIYLLKGGKGIKAKTPGLVLEEEPKEEGLPSLPISVASLGTTELTMSSLEIAELVEKRHDNVKRTIEMLVSRGIIELPQTEEVKNEHGQTVTLYRLNKRSSFIVVAQLSPEFTARLVDRWQELEQKQLNAIPDFGNPVAAARAWADQYEKRLLAEQTKAQIGHRREATAMATASVAVKKNQKLEEQLDIAKSYITIKRMTMIHHGQPFRWQDLREASAEMGLPSIDVFDQNYGSVKGYHKDVWRAVYAITAE